MSNVGYATVSVIPSAENFGTKLKEQVVPAAETAGHEAGEKGGEKLREGMGEHIAEVGKMLVGMFAIGESVEFLKGAVESAEALEKQTEALSVVMEHAKLGSAEAFKEFNASMLEATGTSQLAASQIETSFAKVHDATVPEIEAATKATIDMAAALGMDAPSAAATFSKALVDPAHAARVLKTAGVELNDEQSKSIEKFLKAGEVAKAQGVIIEAVGGKFEGAAHKMETPMDKFKASMGELQLSLGQKLLPVLNKLATALVDTIGWMGDHATLVKILAGTFIALATAMKIEALITGVTKAFALAQAAEEGLTVVQWLLNAAMDANPIGAVVLVILGLIAAVIAVIKYHKQIAEIAVKVWGAIKDAALAAWDWVKSHWTTIVEVIGGPIAILVIQVVKHWDDIKGAAEAAWHAIVSAWNAVVSAVGTAWHAVTDALDAVGKFFEELPGRVLSALEALPGLALQGLKDLAFAIGFGIGLAIKEIIAFPGQVVDIFTTLWHDVTGIATTLWDDEVNGWKTMFHLVIGILTKLPGEIADIFTSLWHDVENVVTTGIDKTVGFFKALPGKAKSALSTLATDVKDAASGAVHWLESAGEDVINGLINGIKGAWHKVTDLIGNLADSVSSGFKKALGINSPSRVFMQHGADTVAGFVLGVSGSQHQATNVITAMANGVANAFNGNGATGVGAALAGAGGGTRTLNYYAGSGGLGSEEELFAAASRSRMVW
jgi:phage-related protein